MFKTFYVFLILAVLASAITLSAADPFCVITLRLTDAKAKVMDYSFKIYGRSNPDQRFNRAMIEAALGAQVSGEEMIRWYKKITQESRLPFDYIADDEQYSLVKIAGLSAKKAATPEVLRSTCIDYFSQVYDTNGIDFGRRHRFNMAMAQTALEVGVDGKTLVGWFRVVARESKISDDVTKDPQNSLVSIAGYAAKLKATESYMRLALVDYFSEIYGSKVPKSRQFNMAMAREAFASGITGEEMIKWFKKVTQESRLPSDYLVDDAENSLVALAGAAARNHATTDYLKSACVDYASEVYGWKADYSGGRAHRFNMAMAQAAVSLNITGPQMIQLWKNSNAIFSKEDSSYSLTKIILAAGARP